MKVNIGSLSKATREYIETRAEKMGITAAQLLRHFDEIVSGRKVSIHSRLLTGRKRIFSSACSV